MAQLSTKLKAKLEKYLNRKNRVNSKIKSHNPQNRVVITKSNMYIKAQVIWLDGKVIASVSDKWAKGSTKTERAFAAWEQLAKLMKDHKVDSAAFDRNGYLYHGRVKAFADGIRNWWIKL